MINWLGHLEFADLLRCTLYPCRAIEGIHQASIIKGLSGVQRLVVPLSSRLLAVNLPREWPQRRRQGAANALSENAQLVKEFKLCAGIPEEPEILVKLFN